MTLYAMTKVGRPQGKMGDRREKRARFTGKLKEINIANVDRPGFCVFLLLLCFGTVKGIPREKALAPQFAVNSIYGWKRKALSGLSNGILMTKLPEATISASALRSGLAPDDQVFIREKRLLFGQAAMPRQVCGAFLANAHLFRSNFQGAFFFVKADLRGADIQDKAICGSRTWIARRWAMPRI